MSGGLSRDGAGRGKPPAWWLDAVILAALLPLFLWRAGLETSIWIDETYSLLLTTHPVGELVALNAATDGHPPTYYLLLKAWLKLGRLLLPEVGVLWARLLNVGVWLAAMLVFGWGARRLVGREVGQVLLAAVAASAASGLVARDLRSYAVAVPALVLVFLAVSALSSTKPGERGREWLWAGFVLMAALAVWSHVLSALALAALMLVAVAWWSSETATRWRRLGEAAVASLVVLGLFSPWLPRLGQQWAVVEGGSAAWMTPPNLTNALLTFLFWFPFGRVGYLNEPINRLLLPFGVLAALLPLSMLTVSVWRARSRTCEPALVRLSGLGLGSSVLFVVFLLALSGLGVAPVFDGPRYPMLLANAFTAGLVGAAFWAAARLGRGSKTAIALLAPWIACGLVGQVYLGSKEASWGVLRHEATVAELLPRRGEPLYVMPSELIPFYRQSLAGFELRAVEDLPCAAAHQQAATVLDVNFWKNLDRPRDHVARRLIEERRLAVDLRDRGFPEPQRDYHLYRLSGLRPAVLAELCGRGFAPAGREAWANASSTASPEQQPPSAEWSYLELNHELELYRWASAGEVRVHFDRPLAAGAWTLHVTGSRTPFPQPEVTLALELEGDGTALTAPLGAGRFHLTLPLELARENRSPILRIRHPTWKPAEALGSADPRTLSFLFFGAWLEERRAP